MKSQGNRTFPLCLCTVILKRETLKAFQCASTVKAVMENTRKAAGDACTLRMRVLDLLHFDILLFFRIAGERRIGGDARECLLELKNVFTIM